jgi:hypothetical protein
MREWGNGIACQFCNQVEGLPTGVRLSSPARRLGGYLLEAVLVAVTLGIGWFVWSLVVWGRGQTPAKQVLRMRTVTLEAGTSASWGRMFLREFIAKPLIAAVSWLTLGIANFWLVWDKQNQELWDKVVGTIVVTDQDRALLEKKRYAIGDGRSGQLSRAGADALPFPARAREPEERESAQAERTAPLPSAPTDPEPPVRNH